MIEEIAKQNEGLLSCDEFFAAMNEKFDQIEAAIVKDLGGQEAPPYPLNHYFTPGLYVRGILLPEGSLTTSKIHLTEHPFIIASGKAVVWCPHRGSVSLQAPYVGITKPGTRRIIFAVTDCVWITCHQTEETDLSVIEKQIIMQRVNPLLADNALPTSNDQP